MPAQSDGDRILAFFEGTATDDRGRSLADVLAFDDAALERIHDYIQWLFPLVERSGANPGAPRLDEAAIAAFRASPSLRAKLRAAFDRMLAFYGLRRNGERVVEDATFASRAQWLTPGNHNHLRLTRIITSLRLLGLEREAHALFQALARLYDTEAGRRSITAETFRYWERAASP